MEGIRMNVDEQRDLIMRSIKRQADILTHDLKRAPERLTCAQRAENIAGMAKRLMELKDD
jgi:hypothetical protein